MTLNSTWIRYGFLIVISATCIFGAIRFQKIRRELARSSQAEIARTSAADAATQLLSIANQRLDHAKTLYLELGRPWPAAFAKPLPTALVSEADVLAYDQHEKEIENMVALAMNHFEDPPSGAKQKWSDQDLARFRSAMSDFKEFEKRTQAQREQFESILRDHFRIETSLSSDSSAAGDPTPPEAESSESVNSSGSAD